MGEEAWKIWSFLAPRTGSSGSLGPGSSGSLGPGSSGSLRQPNPELLLGNCVPTPWWSWLSMASGPLQGRVEFRSPHLHRWGFRSGWDASTPCPLFLGAEFKEAKQAFGPRDQTWNETYFPTGILLAFPPSGIFDCRIGFKHWISILYTHTKRPRGNGDIWNEHQPKSSTCQVFD